jgi:alkylation response protein AidB-like acyl-CoA dehydrogenase
LAIAITAEQAQLADAVGRFADRHAPVDKTRSALDSLAAGEVPPWWGDLVAQGLHAVHIPERFGGQGGQLADIACVIETAARALLPGPLLPTVTASAVALLADDSDGVATLLGELAGGLTAAVVSPDRSTFRATATGDGWQVTGSSGVTLGVCSAARILLSARADDDAPVWIVVDTSAATVTVDVARGTDLTTDVGVLRLDDHHVSASMVLRGLDGERARCVAVSLTACATAGIAQWAVDAVSTHLRNREQFGKLIGTFQALQHRAATLLVNSELATAAAWDAVRAVDETLSQHQLAAAGAAVMAVSPAPELALDALTMFGAIGFTWEHDMHLYWRAATSLAASIGPVARWARQVGQLTAAHARDTSLNLGEVETVFRSRVAETLDEAMALRNDGAGRQGDYEHFATGPQRSLIADAGLIAPHWPSPWGIDANPLQQIIINEEFDKRTALVRPSLGIAEWILPTIVNAGPPDVQERFIPPTQRGELAWCQLFSEPGAGSDLAALATRATKVDGGWRINGHKIWTSCADRADYGALLARTDPAAAKHRGIGYFILDMRSDGIEVQPIRQASGDSDFNEVFLTDVFVPDDMLLGEATDGWGLAIATMAQERVAIGGYVSHDRLGALRALAASAGDEDRQDILRAIGEVEANANAIKALGVRETIRLLDGQAAGPASSIAKVATNSLLRKTYRAILESTGPLAMTEESEPPVVQPYLRLPAELLGGGTNEIQLNIIAQMIMGLPRK